MLCVFLVVLVAAASGIGAQKPVFQSVFTTDRGFELRDRYEGAHGFQPHEVVYGKFNDSIESVGWAFLEIHSNPDVDDTTAMQAAGYFEGYATADRLEQHLINTGLSDFAPSDQLQQYLQTNAEWMLNEIKKHTASDPDDPLHIYWRHVGLVAEQLDGLYNGYQAARAGAGIITKEQMWLLNLYWELDDLIAVYGGNLPPYYAVADHCSALIRLTPNNDDLFISQTTWSSLNVMMRIYKLYDLPLHVIESEEDRVAAVRVAFPAYPGSLFSGDDFYMLSSGLVVQETTIGFNTTAVYPYVVPQSVNEWTRNIVANRLAGNGSQWLEIYSYHNSGTYNNQNMILDYKLFQPGQPVQNETLFISEQMPGTIINHDVSALLEQHGYFASYNRAYDAVIRNISGEDQSIEWFGSYYTWDQTPRALVFQRNISDVIDLESMKAIMRYNNMEEDPLSSQLPSCLYVGKSNCTPPYSGELAIAARGDLNPLDGVYAFYDLGPKNLVSIDAKISSFSTFNNITLPAYAISGPPNTPLPVFVFSTSAYNNTPHIGLPDRWDFPWITTLWEN